MKGQLMVEVRGGCSAYFKQQQCTVIAFLKFVSVT